MMFGNGLEKVEGTHCETWGMTKNIVPRLVN